MIGLLSWVAALLGWLAQWLIGRHRRSGWLLSGLVSVLWIGMSAALSLWGGAVSCTVGAVLAGHNWLVWRRESTS